MAVAETNGDGKPLRESGLYRQQETGAEVRLNASPDLGTPMIDAFYQAGFRKVEEEPVTVVAAPKPVVVETPPQKDLEPSKKVNKKRNK